MAYIFQQGLSDWSKDSGITYINSTTDWIYPTKSKIVNNGDITSVVVTGVTRTIEKNVGVQPITSGGLTGYTYTSYTLPNSNSTGSTFKFKINPNTDDNFNNYSINNSGTIFSNIGSWTNSIGITGNTDSSCYFFSQNVESTNIEIESGWLIVGGFDVGFIDSTKKVKSIQLKVVRKNLAFNDKDFKNQNGGWDSSGNTYGKYLPEVDNILLTSGITTYTRDNIISLHDNYNDEDTLYIQKFDNKSQPYQPETIDIESVDILSNITQTNIFNVPKTLKSFTKPKGIWSNEKETIIYGGDGDLWGSDSDTLTNILISGDFCIKIKINQKVFKGYGYKDFYSPLVLSGNSINLSAWNGSWNTMLYTQYPYRHNKNLLQHYNERTDISFPMSSYLLSRLYSIAIKINYDEETTGYETIVNERVFNELINVPVKTNDVYFKYQYCFDGNCYKYTDSLSDIYKKDITSGNNININNMYNEYNMIDKYIPNLYNVDLATVENIDLSIDHYLIDSEQIKPGQKILLFGQTSASTNDVYTVTNNYTLVNSNILNTITETFRSKIYVKYGSNKGKQFFLKPKSNNIFPISGETKTFEEKHSYIIKHILNYDINSITNDCKILFTDYETARTLNNDTISLYKPFVINYISGTTYESKIEFKYRDLVFFISDKYNDVVSCTGTTIITNSANTIFTIDSNFYDKISIGDYVEINFYETQTQNTNNLRLTYYSNIKNISNNTITLDTYLNQYHIDILSGNSSYNIIDLNYIKTTPYDFVENFKKLPLKDIVYINHYDNNLSFDTKLNNFKWFNYSELEITKINSGITLISTAYTFGSDNQYINYKLKPFFDKFSKFDVVNVYNNETLLISEIYNVDYYLGDYYNYNMKGLLKITPNDTNKLNKFKPYTYVDVTGTGTTSGRTLVIDVNTEYMIIETPLNVTGSFDIKNIYNFQEISDILYEVYRNYTHDWYKKQEDSTLKRICAAYANIIKTNSIIKNQATGIIYQESDKWNFDIFNLQVDDNFNNTFDPNLVYKPIEVLDIGVDRISKLPKVIDISNIDVPKSEVSTILVGNTYKLNNNFDNNSYIYDSVVISGDTYYYGRFDNEFSGNTFEYPFVDQSGSISGSTLMIVKVNSGFTESKFYKINVNNSRLLQPKSIKYINNKLVVFGYAYNYQNSFTLSLSSPDTILNSAITTTYNIGVPYIVSFITEIDTNIDTVTKLDLIESNSTDIIMNDVLYNSNSERIVCGIDSTKTFIYNESVPSNKLEYVGSTFKKMVIDENDNIYIVGYGTNKLLIYKSKNDIITQPWHYSYVITGTTESPKITNVIYDKSIYICLSYKGTIKINNVSYTTTDIGTLLINIDINGIILWVKNINTGNNLSNDMTLDENYIYVVGTYTKTMNFVEPVEIDIPINKTYSYILKIDKNYGGIVSAKNGVTFGTNITYNSVVSYGDYLEIGGYFNGEILINDSSVNKINIEYFITKIKKSDI